MSEKRDAKADLAVCAANKGDSAMRVCLEFKPQDCWIGAFWKVHEIGCWRSLGLMERKVDLWVCLVPMLPIHVTWYVEASQ